jgi:CRISPR-associated protein Cas1
MLAESPLARLLTLQSIRDAAGEQSFSRGMEYHLRGTVKTLAPNDTNSTLNATVGGEKDYTVKISASEEKLVSQCSCPMGLRGAFCKHVVASALAWLENPGQSTGTIPSTPQAPALATVPSLMTLETLTALKSLETVPKKSPPPAAPAVVPTPIAQPEPPPILIAETPPPPDLIPARMLNEFVYCPRLFYYEHVEGVFLHNADTIEGKHQHARVDAGKGGLPSPKKKKRGTPKNSGTEAAAKADTDIKSADTVPSPDAPPETIHARSVELVSDELGVNAKLDLVEGNTAPDGTSTYLPVEYKRGAPREGDDGNALWDADKMQLGLQILLLRHNGYTCDQGVVFYRATRQRVTFTPTAADIAWIKERIAAARAAIPATIPPPLENSPKCPRCSLAPICLPDESRLLARVATEDSNTAAAIPAAQLELDLGDAVAFPPRPPGETWALAPEARLPQLKPADNIRRLIAPNDETRPLYLNTPGAYVARKGETLTVKNGDATLATYRLLDLHHLALFGPVQISTSTVQGCCESGIPVTYFSTGGYFYGITHGHTQVNVTVRIAQFAAAATPERAIRHARLFLHGKIRNQRTLLQRNHLEAPVNTLRALRWLAASVLAAREPTSLLGIEGTAARFYFEHFAGMLHPARHDDNPGDRFAFEFKERNRRPPRDPVNAVLSLLYSLLAKDCTLACHICGLDPYVGFLHQPRHGKPALALDLMEEFRPLIADSTALTLFNNRMLETSSFLTAGRAVALTPAARKTVFIAYEKRLADTITHPVFGYKVSYRRAVELQARLLSKVLTNEIESYIPFTTR